MVVRLLENCKSWVLSSTGVYLPVIVMNEREGQLEMNLYAYPGGASESPSCTDSFGRGKRFISREDSLVNLPVYVHCVQAQSLTTTVTGKCHIKYKLFFARCMSHTHRKYQNA